MNLTMVNGITLAQENITALYTRGNVAIIEKEELSKALNGVYAEYQEFMNESEISESKSSLYAVNDKGLQFRLITEN